MTTPATSRGKAQDPVPADPIDPAIRPPATTRPEPDPDRFPPGQPTAQRQPARSVNPRLSSGSISDGSNQIIENIPNTRGRSWASKSPTIAPVPNPPSSPATPRTTVPASTQLMVGAATDMPAPITYAAVASSSTTPIA